MNSTRIGIISYFFVTITYKTTIVIAFNITSYLASSDCMCNYYKLNNDKIVL